MAQTNTGFIGRRESVGVASEATNGTAVTPTAWQPHLSLAADSKTNTIDNTSAMGRYEEVNDSVIVERWAEGSVDGKIYSNTMGYFLRNMFGTVASAVHAGETTVYDNTFTVLQSGSPKALTLTRVNPLETLAYSYAMLSDLEIEVKAQDWVTFTATFVSKAQATGSGTPSYSTTEYDFSSKDVTVKFAANVAGLSGATAADIRSLKFKISRKIERNTPLSATDPTAIDVDSYDFSGTITQRYTDTVLEAVALANTIQAMSITIQNNAYTIGSSTKPSLTFTMPQVRLDPQTLSNDLDSPLQQTFNFKGQLSLTAGYACQAVLTNTVNGGY